MDTALVWFRRDLRLTDHAALYHALKAARQVHCVFVFDTEILDALEDRSDRRVEFIWESVRALKVRLQAAGSDLTVLHGPARLLIPDEARRLGAGAVFANRDYEPAAKARDAAVAQTLEREGRALHRFKDQVVFDGDEVLTREGLPFRVFTPYRRAWLARLDAFQLRAYPSERHLDRLASVQPAPMPTLEALGFIRTNLEQLGIQPGEAGAHERFRDFQGRIDRYHLQRDFPALEGPSYLSVHLRFGTASIRELVRFAHERGGEGARTWLSELVWREFYQMLLDHYPHTAEHAFRPEFDLLPWPDPPGHFEAWCAARTGYPIIDAALRQLNQTGYMHNRLRMISASFLVKDLHVDWRRGERYFAAKLLDYDQAANVGGWQWSAGVGTDAQPWFRVFNPVTQSKRFDPDAAFIRRWLPELAGLPASHIHTPWTLPPARLAGCDCVVGQDYPAPIVEHAAARAETLALFKQYAARD